MTLNPESVLLIGNFLSGSVGTRGVSEDLRVHLLERGWTVPSASRNMIKPLRLADMLFSTYSLRNQYTVANVEVFSGAAFTWADLVSRLLEMLNKPFNLTLHGGRLADFARRHPRRVQRLLASATYVNTPSRYLQKNFQAIRPDIAWLPNGIDLAQYHTRQREFHHPKLVWLRAFHEIYNPQMAVEVLSILRSSQLDCSLTMIGPDKHDGTYDACQALAKSLGVLDAIQFIGPVDKATVPHWLSQGDIFLNTTRFESFGVSVLEAAACGLPVVTTNVGELPYLWENDVDALLVPPDDAAAMAFAVRRILAEPNMAQKLSSNARCKADNYDWSIILPQWEALFQSLISNA